MNTKGAVVLQAATPALGKTLFGVVTLVKSPFATSSWALAAPLMASAAAKRPPTAICFSQLIFLFIACLPLLHVAKLVFSWFWFD
jgi:hypothetical protein